MSRFLIAPAILAFAVLTSLQSFASISTDNDTPRYSQHQIKKMIGKAHTPEQYSTLATLYRNKQKTYLKEADAAKTEVTRRSVTISSISAKYPRPVDSARYLYEYYSKMASDAGDSASRYQRLSRLSGPDATQATQGTH